MSKAWLTLILIGWTAVSFSQKLKDFPGTYFSADTIHPTSLILKLGSDRSVSGIFLSENGTEYVYFTHKGNQLNGSFVVSTNPKNIQATLDKDLLNVVVSDNLAVQRLTLKKMPSSELDSQKPRNLDQILFGKWLELDEISRQVVPNTYMIFYPDGSLDGVHHKHPRFRIADVSRSGNIKPKWTTQGGHLHTFTESNHPLLMSNVDLGEYRVTSDTLYTTNRLGRIQKYARDKSFLP